MKSVIKREEADQVIKYPCLMEHTRSPGLVVLFYKPECGTIIANRGNIADEIGDYNTIWIMENFKPFKGTIELSN